mmetsp:Transcript_20896/g.52810  ORF Transcript_20896/g.52810 Transcript_20896/m.52810 type:complete len:204 (+) Transcript_20896:2424-3035(+)
MRSSSTSEALLQTGSFKTLPGAPPVSRPTAGGRQTSARDGEATTRRTEVPPTDCKSVGPFTERPTSRLSSSNSSPRRSAQDFAASCARAGSTACDAGCGTSSTVPPREAPSLGKKRPQKRGRRGRLSGESLLSSGGPIVLSSISSSTASTFFVFKCVCFHKILCCESLFELDEAAFSPALTTAPRTRKKPSGSQPSSWTHPRP